MLKPLHLLAAVLCALVSYSQRTDTITLFYKPDKYSVSKLDKQKLDSFLLRGWDRLCINGYTDETEGEEYNLQLSKKRSGEVYWYLLEKNIAANAIATQYFGEALPQADNTTDDGRALNRRTTVVGYKFAKITIKPKDDPMKPVTKKLDNGFIITYKPGGIPDYLSNNFESGYGLDFQVISNTVEMRQNNLFNNTTNGEILSSVLIFRGNGLNPCKLDSPIMIRVPINVSTNCPIQKIKFFNAVAEKGKMIWQEQEKLLYPEVIDGKQYLRVWIDNFCEYINFDIKIDPDCFDLDSTKIRYVNANIRNLSVELYGLNSVYLPRKIDNNTHSLLFEKNKLYNAPVSFTLYDGKRRVKVFRNRSVERLPYDSINNQYIISTASHKFYFPRSKVFDVVLKVNGDNYRVYPENRKCEIVYLNQKKEKILVDFSIVDGRGRYIVYHDQPLELLPFDKNSGYYVIDKELIKTLKHKGTLASK